MNRTKVAKELVKIARSLIGATVDFGCALSIDVDVKNYDEILKKQGFFARMFGSKDAVEKEVVKRLQAEFVKRNKEIAKTIQDKLIQELRVKGVDADINCKLVVI